MATTETPRLVRRLNDRQSLAAIPASTRRARRINAGASFSDIAGSMKPKVTPTAVYHWERAERVPKGDHARQYLELLEALAQVASRATGASESVG